MRLCFLLEIYNALYWSSAYFKYSPKYTWSRNKRFAQCGVVSPACLRKGLYTVGAIDNPDRNPSSIQQTLSMTLESVFSSFQLWINSMKIGYLLWYHQLETEDSFFLKIIPLCQLLPWQQVQLLYQSVGWGLQTQLHAWTRPGMKKLHGSSMRSYFWTRRM